MEKNHSLSESFRHAAEGFWESVKSERNMKIHCAATAAVAAASFILGLTAAEKAVLLMLCGLVISAELFNTSIENAVDLVSPDFDPLAKRAKDTAAAAVLAVSIVAAVVGVIVFWPYAMDCLYIIQRII